MCVVFWLIGFSICVPTLVGWTFNLFDVKVLECFWSRTHNLSFTIFFTTCVVFLPIFVISFSFIRIFTHVRNSKKRVGVLKANQTTITTVASSNEKAVTKPKANTTLRLATSLLTIFGVFVICWAPYSLLIVIDHHDSLPMEVYLYSLMLAHMHSTLNSFVYYKTNPHFRTGYKLVVQVFTFNLISPNEAETQLPSNNRNSLTVNKA